MLNLHLLLLVNLANMQLEEAEHRPMVRKERLSSAVLHQLNLTITLLSVLIEYSVAPSGNPLLLGGVIGVRVVVILVGGVEVNLAFCEPT